MGRVDDAPARVERRMIGQPLDRALARPGQAGIDLGALLRRMNVNRRLAGKLHDRMELFRRDGAQAVWRHADPGVRERGNGASREVPEVLVGIDRRDKASLSWRRRGRSKPTLAVQHRQERQSDSRRRCRSCNARAHFCRVAVRAPVARMMEVVKFTNASETCFQHFDERLCRDGFELIGIQSIDERVHRRAPGPEVVRLRAARFGQSSHGALKGVAMKVGNSGDCDAMPFVVGLCARVDGDVCDQAIEDLHSHAATPSAAQQRAVEPECAFIRRWGSRCVHWTIACGADMYRHYMRVDQLWRNARLATLVPDVPGIGVVEDGMVASRDGRIAYAGSASRAPRFEVSQADTDCKRRWITPGLIDCHTHLVHAGDRAWEFEQRLAGADYAAIAAGGGGILSTVRATRAAQLPELVSASLPRLDALLAEGVTTLEVKSGYGLDTETEVRQLRAARELARHREVSISTTFLGAHAVPPEMDGSVDRYLDLLCNEMLPAIVTEGLADAVDAYGEHLAFAPHEIRRVFAAAKALGLATRLHADQLSNQHGAALAAEFGCLSADHLEFTDEAGVASLAAAGTTAVMLPAAYYALRETQRPPIESLRRHGVPLAVATDCNPGTAPLTSILLAMNMAATLFQMTVEECIAGVTREAARALGLLSNAGTLEAGKWCDLAIWDIERPAELVYRMGFNPLHRRIRRGR